MSCILEALHCAPSYWISVVSGRVSALFTFRARHVLLPFRAARTPKRPTPRLPSIKYRVLGRIRLLARMKTSRSRRKRKKKGSNPTSASASLFFINARDLRSPPTVTKVSRLIAGSFPDLLAVTETWFTEESGDFDARLVCPSGYAVTQNPRRAVAAWTFSIKITHESRHWPSSLTTDLLNSSTLASFLDPSRYGCF